jgi:phenylalanyl-tRNA synthetase beta chain
MKFTLSWLKQLLDTAANADEIALALNSIGFEVEGVEDKSAIYNPFIIAEIKEATRHPDADKLNVCQVNNGHEILQIVCAATNARAGIKVVLAPVGTTMPNAMQIKLSKIRGIESKGMLCAADELLLEENSEGIIELGSDAVVGAKYADYANLNDVVFDVALTANRGDGASVYGIARDLAAKGIGTLKPLAATALQYTEDKSPIAVTIEDEGCHAFSATYISGINNLPRANIYADALKGIGGSPKTPLVDISNFAMMNYGRPNHIYDADKIKGDLVIRKSRADEPFVAIGGQEYKLPEGLTVVADSEMVVCIGGVIGGELSKVTEETKNILVEVGDFDPIAVTNSGRVLNQHTDARFRFERGIDHGNTESFVDLPMQPNRIHLWWASNQDRKLLLVKPNSLLPKLSLIFKPDQNLRRC